MGDLGGLAGLVGGSVLSPTGSVAGSSVNGEPAEKRQKLRHYDLVAAQVLNPMGSSGIETIGLGPLWAKMCAGNKQAAAFSEFCFDSDERRGVALSRFAEVLLIAIQRLKNSQHTKEILKPPIYEAIMQEITSLEVHLKCLDQGRLAASSSASMRAIAYSRAPSSDVSPGDPRASSEAIHDWLMQPQSALRTALALFSGGGIFYVAQCHEKGARAWLASIGDRSKSKEAMHAAALARSQPQTRDDSSSDLLGFSQL